jgi:CubicO group peptidase (beta-lactamase class C family)
LAEPGNAITTTTTTFRLASVSKLFTAAAVQRLDDDGVIDLSTAVFGYLGLFDPVPHDTRKDGITIAQCATSLSGMPHDYEKAGMKLRDASVGLGHHASVAEQAAHMYFAVPLAFPPGTPPAGTGDTGYSNTAFDVLAAVIEKATGMRYRTGAMLPSQLDLSPTVTEVDVYGGDFFLEPRPASGGLH